MHLKNTPLIKNFFLSLLLFSTIHTHAMNNTNNIKIGGCILFAGISSYFCDSIAQSKLMKKIAESTDTNAHDIADIIPLSLIAWSASYYCSRGSRTQRALRYASLAAPVVIALTTSTFP